MSIILLSVRFLARVAGGALLMLAVQATAQSPRVLTGEPSQPARVLTGEGLKKLDVFVGTWKGESLVDAAHPDKISAVNKIQWSPNGKYLVADQLVTREGKLTNNLSIYTYDADKGGYTLSLVGVPGMQPFSIGVIARGDTLFYNSEYTDNGKKMYNRTLNIFSSPSLYIYKIQSSEDGVNWQTNGEGKSEKMR